MASQLIVLNGRSTWGRLRRELIRDVGDYDVLSAVSDHRGITGAGQLFDPVYLMTKVCPDWIIIEAEAFPDPFATARRLRQAAMDTCLVKLPGIAVTSVNPRVEALAEREGWDFFRDEPESWRAFLGLARGRL